MITMRLTKIIPRSITRILLSALFALLLAATDAAAQRVLKQAQIGGYSEDITYVTSGRLKDSIIMLDGYDVYAVPKKARDPLEKLFDVKAPEIDTNPNGIAYIESEGLFAVNNVTQPTKLFFFDQNGAFKGSRPIKYLNGYAPQHMEGMGYIPPNSPTFPDHIVMGVLDTLSGPSRIEVVRRDGQVVAEILPNWPDNPNFDTSFIGGVTYYASNKLLVTFFDNTIWTIDFAGNVLAGPQVVAGANGFEGIVQMKDGSVVAVNYPQSIFFFDGNLNRQPASDRNDLFGLNLNTPIGVAWNTDTNKLLIEQGIPGTSVATIASVPVSLDGATTVADLSAFPGAANITYLPGEHLIAVAHRNNPRAILLFNNDGTPAGQIDLSPASLGQNLGPPSVVEYLPATNEFAVGFNGINGNPGQPAEQRRLRIISRAGALVRTIDLTCAGTKGRGAVAYFEDPDGGGGRLMILASAGRVLITDMDGNLLSEFNSRVKLGLLSRGDIAAITSGPMAGAFCMVDNRGSEAVIFRID
ncbi:MAG TPA: hypothetical protein VJZ26_15870 [Blastocatellia bacterium]|nr:hypothetical protein [Blastocatellia bacterium]